MKRRTWQGIYWRGWPNLKRVSANNMDSQDSCWWFWRKKTQRRSSETIDFHDRQTKLNLAHSLGPRHTRIDINTSIGNWSNAPVEDSGNTNWWRPELELERVDIDSQIFLSSAINYALENLWFQSRNHLAREVLLRCLASYGSSLAIHKIHAYGCNDRTGFSF